MTLKFEPSHSKKGGGFTGPVKDINKTRETGKQEKERLHFVYEPCVSFGLTNGSTTSSTEPPAYRSKLRPFQGRLMQKFSSLPTHIGK